MIINILKAPRLYVKALVLKEVCKASLRYAESLSKTHLGVRIPKSTLHYWEVRHGEIDYDYSVVYSTKFTDWLKTLHELFIDVRVRYRAYDEALYAYRGGRRKSIRSTNSRVQRQAENEEGGINKDENAPKDHNILPKDPSEVGL